MSTAELVGTWRYLASGKTYFQLSFPGRETWDLGDLELPGCIRFSQKPCKGAYPVFLSNNYGKSIMAWVAVSVLSKVTGKSSGSLKRRLQRQGPELFWKEIGAQQQKAYLKVKRKVLRVFLKSEYPQLPTAARKSIAKRVCQQSWEALDCRDGTLGIKGAKLFSEELERWDLRQGFPQVPEDLFDRIFSGYCKGDLDFHGLEETFVARGRVALDEPMTFACPRYPESIRQNLILTLPRKTVLNAWNLKCSELKIFASLHGECYLKVLDALCTLSGASECLGLLSRHVLASMAAVLMITWDEDGLPVRFPKRKFESPYTTCFWPGQQVFFINRKRKVSKGGLPSPDLGKGSFCRAYTGFMVDLRTLKVWQVCDLVARGKKRLKGARESPEGQNRLNHAEKARRIAARFDHPNILSPLKRDGKTLFLSYTVHLAGGMERGKSVCYYPLMDGTIERLPLKRFAMGVHGLAKGLEKVHEHGLVHLDVKEKNTFWSRELQEGVLGDFGLTCSEGITLEGWAGSPLYLDPQMAQSLGEDGSFVVKKSMDVWSFGMSIYHRILGEPTPEIDGPQWLSALVDLDQAKVNSWFQKKTTEIWWKDEQEQTLGLKLLEVAKACMQVKPENRPCMNQILVWLERIEEDTFSVRPPAPRVPDPVNHQSPRNPADEDKNLGTHMMDYLFQFFNFG